MTRAHPKHPTTHDPRHGGQARLTTRIGILGGTFDPIHNGHLRLLRAARKTLGLRRVFVVPTHRTPLKNREAVSASDRAAMIRLAIRALPFARLSLFEVRRKRLSYSVDTLKFFRKKLGPAAEIFFICGADLIPTIRRWKDPERVRRMCRFAVAVRPGARRPPAGFLRIAMKPTAVSSTEIQRRLRAGKPVRGMLPAAVRRYIRRRALYGAARA